MASSNLTKKGFSPPQATGLLAPVVRRIPALALALSFLFKLICR